MKRWHFALWLLVFCRCAAGTPVGEKPPVATIQPRALSAAQRLAEARQLFAKSEYDAAEREFTALENEACCQEDAQLGLARIAHVRGKYQEAQKRAAVLISSAQPHKASQPETARQAALWLLVESHRALGELAEAEALLKPLATDGTQRQARVVLAEVLIEQGRRGEAEPLLMSLVEDYNEDRIADDDGAELVWLARAAHWLRSPEDANDAFNLAEQALGFHEPVLLFRAELYLDKYDPGHAEEVLSEVLERAPNHPLALVMLAQVKLDQALDFREARRLTNAVLATNPNLARAHFVLAGLALRDMKLGEARAHAEQGLRTNPRDLELLSLVAAAQFLADDPTGFEQTRERVLKLNPAYSRFYQIVGEYADWEHRYTEIVQMMREAVTLDPLDAKAYAQLGINLIRKGDDPGGLSALRRAYSQDPFNVRVVNTLNLYEQVIAQQYHTERTPLFTFRYPKAEQELLSRYVPELMEAAWSQFTRFYAFTPETPVGIELYRERAHFAVRTSGLPRTAIQGVCFGNTLASLSPTKERFNLGMTLWHELAHVFHIQLSKSRVPRWFTEGLAEYETLVERPEWKRERDAELFQALHAGRIPKISALNEAFTHAEDLLDVTVAYYASTQIVTLLAEEYGRPKLNKMLELWGAGHSTESVVQQALGITTSELDTRFAAFLEKRLARFRQQFVPITRSGSFDELRAAAKQRPEDPELQTRLALLALEQHDLERAGQIVDRVLKKAPKNPNALWLKARLQLAKREPEPARHTLLQLTSTGNDGAEVQALLARTWNPSSSEFRAALERAHQFDPERADVLLGLLQLARQDQDQVAEVQWLEKLTRLEEHDGALFRSLLTLRSELGQHDEALRLGEAAVFADMANVETHVAFAKALERAGNLKRAEFQFQSAAACPAPPSELARAQLEWARFLQRIGRKKDARERLEHAIQLDPALQSETL